MNGELIGNKDKAMNDILTNLESECALWDMKFLLVGDI